MVINILIFFCNVAFSLDARNQAACEAKSTPELTYVWGVPFDAYDELNTIEPECLVQPKAIECAQAPWSR